MLDLEAVQQNGNGSTSPEGSDSSSETDGPTAQRQPTATDLGKRVLFYSSQDRKEKFGVLRYIGGPEFAEGVWCGIELDGPEGKNNGSLQGIRYFSCEANYGVFVPVGKVELDPTRRSRGPSSKPGSRPASAERQQRRGSPGRVLPLQVGGKSASIQQELAYRLNPAIRTKTKQSQPAMTNPRQPMKAFAPHRGSKDNTAHKVTKKSTVPLGPFKGGGMYKAMSTENLRSFKDKDQQGKPVKKSSSERDLRSANSKTSASTNTVKLRKKQGRTSSLSDETVKSEHSTRRSSIESTLTSSLTHWPKTSTPNGCREESSPDGCSSPDESECGSCSSHEASPPSSQGSQCEHGLTPDHQRGSPASTSIATAEKAFVATPDLQLQHPAGRVSAVDPPPVVAGGVPMGLATHASQLAETERSSPAVGPCRVPSPDSLSRPRYQNRPSGTATLEHPLTRATNAPEVSSGSSESSLESSSHTTRTQDSAILDPSHPVGSVSVAQLIDFLRGQHKHWHNTQAQLEERMRLLEWELVESRRTFEEEIQGMHCKLLQVQSSCQAEVEQLESRHQSQLRQLSATHQQELIALQKAHRHTLEEQRREYEKQTTV